jgi:hypothetical protein
VAVVRESEEALVLRIGPVDRLALRELSGVDRENRTEAAIAEKILRDSLITLVAAAGLASPYEEAAEATATPEEPERQQTAWARFRRRREVRAVFVGGAAVGLVVTLIGGYGYGWGWTGFGGNKQLWDWLKMLILPIAFGTFALWLKHGGHMSRRRRLVLAGAVLAFAGFVAAGYLVPLTWTGFKGNTLWDWLTLLLLPLVLMTVKLWPATTREIGAGHITFSAALAVALTVTLIGGYAGNWSWTGYPGNTLWDWMSLVLGPVVIATFVIPAAIRWVSGDVERVAEEASAGKPHP